MRDTSDEGISLPNRWLWLVLLIVAAVLNYVDRLSIAVLQVPIKAELGLSDTYLGILTGLAFAMVYTFAAIPMAGLADRYSRKTIIIVALTTWSLMTLLCGFSTSFLSLCIFRMGVAIGEAGCNPSALAILADSFKAKDRPRAIAIWHYAMPIGITIGIGGSGLALQYLGWRGTFFLLGAVGLLFVPVLMLFLKDPRTVAGGPVQSASSNGLMAHVASAWSSPNLRLNVIGGAFMAYTFQVLLNWGPPYYAREFDMPIEKVAGYLSMVIAGGGVAGISIATLLSHLPGRNDVRWYFWLPALTSLLTGIAVLVQFTTQNAQLSLLVGLLPFVLFNIGLPVWAACAQRLVKPGERAMAAGLQTFAAGIVASAGGPFITGVLSDLFSSMLGDSAEGLRWAIICSVLCSLVAAATFLRGARGIRDELPNALKPAIAV